jgi:hypothetical protein
MWRLARGARAAPVYWLSAIGDVARSCLVASVAHGEPKTAQKEPYRSCNPSNQEMRHSCSLRHIFPARRIRKRTRISCGSQPMTSLDQQPVRSFFFTALKELNDRSGMVAPIIPQCGCRRRGEMPTRSRNASDRPTISQRSGCEWRRAPARAQVPANS